MHFYLYYIGLTTNNIVYGLCVASYSILSRSMATLLHSSIAFQQWRLHWHWKKKSLICNIHQVHICLKHFWELVKSRSKHVICSFPYAGFFFLHSKKYQFQRLRWSDLWMNILKGDFWKQSMSILLPFSNIKSFNVACHSSYEIQEIWFGKQKINKLKKSYPYSWFLPEAGNMQFI